MLSLVDITESGIEVSKWLGRWLEVLVEEDLKLKVWVLQREVGEMLMIQDLDEVLQE